MTGTYSDPYETWTDAYKDDIMGQVQADLGHLPDTKKLNSLSALMKDLATFTGSNFYSADALWMDAFFGKNPSNCTWDDSQTYCYRDVTDTSGRVVQSNVKIVHKGYFTDWPDNECFKEQWPILSAKAVEYGIAGIQLLFDQTTTCTYDCSGRECGNDGCEGSCGTCTNPCNNELDNSVCIDGKCTTPCCPNCDGKVCGDDGCGGSCDSCQMGYNCNEGKCTAECGPNSCGESCGDCSTGYSCKNKICIEDCIPNCTGKECGPNGCGSICGSCDVGYSCQESGTCIEDCIASCSGKQCGDDKCGKSCGPLTKSCTSTFGTCSANGIQNCVNGNYGTCSATDPRTANCSGKVCGDDSCGGTCGSCNLGYSCKSGTCVKDCIPSCSGKVCGDNGCGKSCGPLTKSCTSTFGTCSANGIQNCVNGNYGTCSATDPRTANCSGKVCGDDSCGGTCGSCNLGYSCKSGTCVKDCIPSCSGKVCGDNGCGKSCGPLTKSCTSTFGTCSTSGIQNCVSGNYNACSATDPRIANCSGKECGSDKCGGSCGSCNVSYKCENYICVSVTCADGLKFVDLQNGTINECQSNRIWQKGTAGKKTWNDAVAYCENLNFSSHTNWTLPGINLLRSLIVGCPATQSDGSCKVIDGCGTGCSGAEDVCKDGCALNEGPSNDCYMDSVFDGKCDAYWSSSVDASNTSRAWRLHFDHGSMYPDQKYGEYQVRCVSTECSCNDKECGDDGCGGTCGSCDPDDYCKNGVCVDCIPSCSGKSC